MWHFVLYMVFRDTLFLKKWSHIASRGGPVQIFINNLDQISEQNVSLKGYTYCNFVIKNMCLK